MFIHILIFIINSKIPINIRARKMSLFFYYIFEIYVLYLEFIDFTYELIYQFYIHLYRKFFFSFNVKYEKNISQEMSSLNHCRSLKYSK